MTPEEIARVLRFKDMPENIQDEVFENAVFMTNSYIYQFKELIENKGLEEKLIMSSIYYHFSLFFLKAMILGIKDEYTQKEFLEYAIEYLTILEDENQDKE